MIREAPFSPVPSSGVTVGSIYCLCSFESSNVDAKLRSEKRPTQADC